MRSGRNLSDAHQPAFFMQAALREAHKAALIGEVPIGAVIVLDGQIIARGHNRRETVRDVTLHAEIVAIRKASRRLKSWRLENCELYVTLEPCIMCAGAIVQARIGHVYFGADDPKAGAAGSIADIFSIRQNHQVDVTRQLLADDCSLVLKAFFAKKRQQDKVEGTRAQRRQAALKRQSDELLTTDKDRRTV